MGPVCNKTGKLLKGQRSIEVIKVVVVFIKNDGVILSLKGIYKNVGLLIHVNRISSRVEGFF